MENVLAIDIGGSKTICAVIDKTGNIIDSVRYDYPPGYTVDSLIKKIHEGYEALRHHSVSSCGVAIPGLCDVKNGMWLYSPFSNISSIPIVEIISQMTGLSVYADNDVNISALAEHEFGITKNVDDYLWITVSNGIGGGLVLNGRLYRGANMFAGEIGHITVEENTDRICGCGKRGCLEIMASGASIADIYNKKSGSSVIGAKEVAERLRGGDKIAHEVFEDTGKYIGKAVAAAINLLGISTVVIGGGVSEEFELFKNSAQTSMKKHLFLQANHNAKILCSSLKKDAALLGCVALVKQKETKF